MNKIILFYKYIAIEYPKQIMKWQREICQNLGLMGRILISHEGINGTLGGSVENLDEYIKIMSTHELFKNIDFKESAGEVESFPRLSVKVRDEAEVSATMSMLSFLRPVSLDSHPATTSNIAITEA